MFEQLPSAPHQKGQISTENHPSLLASAKILLDPPVRCPITWQALQKVFRLLGSPPAFFRKPKSTCTPSLQPPFLATGTLSCMPLSTGITFSQSFRMMSSLGSMRLVHLQTMVKAPFLPARPCAFTQLTVAQRLSRWQAPDYLLGKGFLMLPSASAKAHQQQEPGEEHWNSWKFPG